MAARKPGVRFDYFTLSPLREDELPDKMNSVRHQPVLFREE